MNIYSEPVVATPRRLPVKWDIKVFVEDHSIGAEVIVLDTMAKELQFRMTNPWWVLTFFGAMYLFERLLTGAAKALLGKPYRKRRWVDIKSAGTSR